MNWFPIIFLFAIGCCVGSFLNVCIYRLPLMRSIVWPGSRCPTCLTAVRAWDNIPVLSWFILGGRCRDCGAPFSIRYAAVEFLTGVLFAAFYGGICMAGLRDAGPVQPVPPLGLYLFTMYLVCVLIVATFIDFDYKLIPDAVTVPAIVVGLIASAVWPGLQTRPIDWAAPRWLAVHPHWQGLATSVWGLIVGGGLIWAVRGLGRVVFRKEAMGFGDVILMAAIGAFIGWQGALVVFLLAPFFGIGVGLFQWLARRDNVMPYGPYLSLATILVLFGIDGAKPVIGQHLWIVEELCLRMWQAL